MWRLEQDDLIELNQQQTTFVKLFLTSSSSYQEFPAKERNATLEIA
jgi:hypothetical protein